MYRRAARNGPGIPAKRLLGTRPGTSRGQKLNDPSPCTTAWPFTPWQLTLNARPGRLCTPSLSTNIDQDSAARPQVRRHGGPGRPQGQQSEEGPAPGRHHTGAGGGVAERGWGGRGWGGDGGAPDAGGALPGRHLGPPSPPGSGMQHASLLFLWPIACVYA